MALRTIRTMGESVLEKECKPITEVTERIDVLIDDMFETMYDAQGVGLAAPQVGILKRLFVIDVGDENGDSDPIVLINPEVVEVSGEQTDFEGCLSVPGKVGRVTRPNYAKFKGFDRNLNPIVVEGEGLKARALLHENDHLDGHIYVEKVEGRLYTNEELDEMMEAEEEQEE